VRRLLGLLVLALALAAAAAERAEAVDPALRPLDLTVIDGSTSWHPDNDFRLYWDLPRDGNKDMAVAAVHFRLRDGDGRVALAEQRLPGWTNRLDHVAVPWGPGAYEVELWLEAPGGETGPVVTTSLLFDDTRPEPTRPLVPAGWFAGDEIVRLKLEHPAGPQPVSGIRGYAVAVGPGAGGAPCAGPARCKLEETDVRAGIADDTVSLGLLPEGDNLVRAVSVSGSGVRSAETSAVVRVDATGPAVGLDPTTGWVDHPVRVSARALDRLSGMAPGGPAGPYTAISVDAGPPRLAAGASVAAPVSGEGIHTVVASARDAAGNLGEAPERVRVRIDESPPAIAFARAQDPADPERIEASVADALSGPDPSRGSIAVRPAGSRRRFQALPTRFERGRLVAHWDSEGFAAGSYEFRASAADVAGNPGSAERRADGARMVLAAPLKTPTSVWGRLGGGGPARGAGDAVGATVYRGRLTSIAGAPLAGREIEIVESFADGASPARNVSVVRTAADGRFRARLAPGPSRQLEAVFAGTRDLGRSRGGEASLPVRSRVGMRASSPTAPVGGPPVVFRGRLGDRGAPIPAGGRSIELQFRLPDGEWSQFRTIGTDRRGRFRYAYAFRDDDSRGVRFQFRAFVPAQPGWPYEPAGSKPVFVTGR